MPPRNICPPLKARAPAPPGEGPVPGPPPPVEEAPAPVPPGRCPPAPPAKPPSELANTEGPINPPPTEGASPLAIPIDGAGPETPPIKSPRPLPRGSRLALGPPASRVCLPLASRISTALPPGRHSDHLPRRANWRPSPPHRPPRRPSPGPLPRAATRHRGPRRPGAGRPGIARSAWLGGRRCTGESYARVTLPGPPQQDPPPPDMPHTTQRSHYGEPQSPGPGPFGQGQTGQRTGEYPTPHYPAARRRGIAHDSSQGVGSAQSAPPFKAPGATPPGNSPPRPPTEAHHPHVKVGIFLPPFAGASPTMIPRARPRCPPSNPPGAITPRKMGPRPKAGPTGEYPESYMQFPPWRGPSPRSCPWAGLPLTYPPSKAPIPEPPAKPLRQLASTQRPIIPAPVEAASPLAIPTDGALPDTPPIKSPRP
ncbi:uncharacterized protein PGRI_096170 [Penicillium griseofulvum]|uniref:Uncharacterized protein n=1 Tax=Penicillium patulum TaxID=5078 RepID=A0A135M0P7_PENPA|nr:uncharacterized protein PGRI_096170 [Penicillium griseofulvum]KXG54741.1 hypothetical protein PGRI_096170 [Penicillium griseofulvum]